MLHFDKQILANSALHRGWRQDVLNARRLADRREAELVGNEAAILPRDAYREMDALTKELMRGDGGSAFMEDLMPLALAVDIGKTVVGYRASSDAGTVIRSMTGQVATPTDKTDYKYGFSPVPVFGTSYFRNWREQKALESEGFNALRDDQYNCLFNLRRDNALYVLNGDASVVVDGHQGYGIRTNPNSKAINIGATGANIDLSTATPDQVLAFFDTTIMAALDANFINEDVNFYVSPEIARNLEQNLSSAEGFKGGTLREALEAKARIGRIKRTFELTGNAFVAFVPSERFIRPLVGMATSTVPIPRFHPHDNYVFRVWNAMGLEIRADYNGKSGVFYSTLV